MANASTLENMSPVEDVQRCREAPTFLFSWARLRFADAMDL
jgi:hypothetical protein